MERYNDDLQQQLANTPWAGTCTSWYKTADGKILNNWPASAQAYAEAVARFDAGAYRDARAAAAKSRAAAGQRGPRLLSKATATRSRKPTDHSAPLRRGRLFPGVRHPAERGLIARRDAIAGHPGHQALFSGPGSSRCLP